MGKYAPFMSFLIEQGRDLVPMTYSEIETVLDLKLPASKRYPAWWSNNPSNNPMTKEWLAAGYETESVDVIGEKVVFRRVRKTRPVAMKKVAASGHRGSGFMEGQPGFETSQTAGATDEYIVAPRGGDPLFGCMAGTLTLLPDYDYTAPADPDWGKVYED